MAVSPKCPGCAAPLSFTRFAAAPTPWHLRCAGCNGRLAVGYTGLLVTLGLGAVLLEVAVGVLFAFRDRLDLSMGAFGLAVITAALAEAGIYVQVGRGALPLTLRAPAGTPASSAGPRVP